MRTTRKDQSEHKGQRFLPAGSRCYSAMRALTCSVTVVWSWLSGKPWGKNSLLLWLNLSHALG